MRNTNLLHFPDNTFRAIVGESWLDGTYAACIAWLIANGITEVSMGNYRGE